MENIKCPGFKACGTAAGIKKNNAKDLGIICSETPATVAGVFTKNKVKASCVLLNMKKVQQGRCSAIIVNSGNANCCAGQKEMQDTEHMAELAAARLGISPDSVLVASTGVIGQPLPMEKIEAAMPGLADSLSPEGFSEFAEAVMTTDTVPKAVSFQGTLEDKTFTVTGIAKGSGMVKPDMATMLCFICSDINAKPEALQQSLKTAVDRSFNIINVDGDTSTNDMVLAMANGQSGISLDSDAHADAFQKVLDDVCFCLAKMLVKDAEGATKLAEIEVKGAASDQDAKKIAETVAGSNLVKTALFGEDANWGRIIAAAGRSGAKIDPDKIDIYFNDVLTVKSSTGCGDSSEDKAAAVLKKSEFIIIIDLHMGNGSARMFTCDFSVDYVRINADYRT